MPKTLGNSLKGGDSPLSSRKESPPLIVPPSVTSLQESSTIRGGNDEMMVCVYCGKIKTYATSKRAFHAHIRSCAKKNEGTINI